MKSFNVIRPRPPGCALRASASHRSSPLHARLPAWGGFDPPAHELCPDRSSGGGRVSQEERRLLAVTASGALGLLVMLFVLWPAPASVLFLGVITGSLSALTAMG